MNWSITQNFQNFWNLKVIITIQENTSKWQIFLNYSKASDKIDHQLMGSKLIYFVIEGDGVFVLLSFLTL